MSNRESFSHAIKCFSDPQRRNEYFQLYSDDLILHGYQGIEPGLESVKQFYYSFWKLFPDAQVLIQDLIGEGDTLVARYTITGTMHEAFMGVPATGQRIELPGISILHFRNGQCFGEMSGQHTDPPKPPLIVCCPFICRNGGPNK